MSLQAPPTDERLRSPLPAVLARILHHCYREAYLWLEFLEAATADKVTVLRPEVEPRSQDQIDYGYLGQ